MNYFNVAIIGAGRGSSKLLTYSSKKTVHPGALVKAPIGKKTALGVVLCTTNKPSFETKLAEVIEPKIVPPYLIELAEWISKYYATELSQTLQKILPSGFGKNRRNQFTPEIQPPQTSMIELTKDQQSIVESISDSDTRSHLLHGATGSGKTHVYLSLIQNAINQKRSAILLLPEIALSHHLLERIRPLLSVSLIELSSDLTAAQRHMRWSYIAQSNQPLVVVGPRSAVFAPLNNLGLIIVDEAHDNSFSETSRPHYDATFVAAKRSDIEQAKLVLGTATPNISQYYLAERHMQIHKLPTPHYNQIKQNITTVPLSDKSEFKTNRSLSNSLLESIAASLANKQQSLLFINKRGFSRIIQCLGCGWIMECELCQLPIVYHKQNYNAQCHTCGRNYKPPSSCQECQSTDIKFSRPGTQRIEQDVSALFPKANVIRTDRDQSQSESAINSADILIGTQLLIKGFDLPKLSTVGVIHADSGLGLPDYNASETVYQQLRQVIGRNNRRGQGGNTIVQAMQPEHHSIQSAINDDYKLFYETEIKHRKTSNYPPFTHLLLIKVRYKTDGKAEQKLQTIKQHLNKTYPELEILGPSPALRQFAHGYHHWQLLVKSAQRSKLVEIAIDVQTSRIDTHINPSSLL